jgi:N6-L-threonylcarbamoyladenine synthase
LNDLAASFQAAVCDLLVAKTAEAVIRSGCKRVVVAGGVACNSGLRAAMLSFAVKNCVNVYFPSPALCADNAAMIAVPGDYYLSRGISALDFDAVPGWPLDLISAESQGRPIL